MADFNASIKTNGLIGNKLMELIWEEMWDWKLKYVY